MHNVVGIVWCLGLWYQFLERQKDLSLRQDDSTAHVHMNAMNFETILLC